MCGIGGEITPTRLGVDARQHRLSALLTALARRGPDASTVWVDDDLGLSLGHRRLAVIDLGPTGTQPMISASGRWVLTYNGEVYNHRELRHHLEHLGVRFRGSCDAETLVEAFDAWGIHETLQRANGMFAFGVWDRVEQRLTLARDRMGEKPLYWTQRDGHFGFASELKGLMTLPWVDREIDEDAVSSVLSWGYVMRPHSIYRKVFQLEPGQLLEVRRLDTNLVSRHRTWWSLADTITDAVARRQPVAVQDAATELEPLLQQAVASRLHSDVPLGSFLSGGVDSALIAMYAQRALGSTPLQTFTVKMPDMGIDESAQAAEVAGQLGTRHTEVELSERDALDLVPSLSTAWDEPFGDPSMIPSLLLCRAARQNLTVCLAGDGGDELFAGYNRHGLASNVFRATGRIPAPLRAQLGRALGALPVGLVDSALTRARPITPSGWHLPNMGNKVHKVAAVMRDGGEGGWSQMASVWPDVRGRQRVNPPSTPAGLSGAEGVMWADTASVLTDNMLVKMDRASMFSSLEVRSPFLDPALLDWAWAQPMSVKTDQGVGKRVLRTLAERAGLAEVARRPKLGFDPPLADWLRGPLRNWASDLLTAPRCVEQGYLHGEEVSRTWREHGDSAQNHEYKLWALLMMETWFHEHA